MKDKTPSQYNELLPPVKQLQALLDCRCGDPHAILGAHFREESGATLVRHYAPTVRDVTLLLDGKRLEMTKIHSAGLFAVEIPDIKPPFNYQIECAYENSVFTSADPYAFMPGIGEMDTHLFNEGEHRRVYDMMGAHQCVRDGVNGTLFTVWAPNAQGVSVVGNFNNWDGRRHQMRMYGSSGVWELFIPAVSEGDIYKFEIRDGNGNILLKLDPYAYRTEMRPNSAAVVTRPCDFKWNDEEWIDKRKNAHTYDSPMLIYEIHLSSWQHPSLRSINPHDDNDFHNYRELAHALADYVTEMGYTHVELLPVAEHPLDQSWGYQVTGYFAPTARYGTPEDFAYFVNHLHSKGIGVILDWVPAHFPKDQYSLGRFDGTALYEHQDPRQGEHRDWGTYIFNFGRNEVRNFLIGNALYWLDKFHIDGLRVDAVASMLYLDYSREEGEWVPNKYGGRENLDAISFMKRLNELTNELYPGTMMIAEESTAWPGVSRPVYLGGLGYSFKWNMGWMHDTLKYYSLDPIYRSYHHYDLTFSMLYAFSENFILPLSHDEVVHGKRSLLDKMSGDYWQKFANLRALYTYMVTHPGKILMFMGGEFGQWNEWNSNVGLDWCLLDYPAHDSLRTMMKELNHLYKQTPSLWQSDFGHEGFEWIDANDTLQSVFTYIRWDKSGNPVVVALNLTSIVRENYRIGVPRGGAWEEIFNSDEKRYGGSGVLNGGDLFAEEVEYHAKPNSLNLRLPPLGACVYRPK